LYFAGIDIGSTMTKVVLMDTTDSVMSAIKGPTGPEHRQLANEVMRMALEQANLQLDNISYIIATGYGRVNVPFADDQITELSCHARGVYSLFPNVRTAIDIGGQDAKCMKIDKGKLADFVMNDKCAAGTGRFLEVMAQVLEVGSISEMGPIALKSKKPCHISSTCTVFAETEVVVLRAEGKDRSDLIAGVHKAVASRVAVMASSLSFKPDAVFTGGVAKNVGVKKFLEENIGLELLVPEEPQIIGALGAALFAQTELIKRK